MNKYGNSLGVASNKRIQITKDEVNWEKVADQYDSLILSANSSSIRMQNIPPPFKNDLKSIPKNTPRDPIKSSYRENPMYPSSPKSCLPEQSLTYLSRLQPNMINNSNFPIFSNNDSISSNLTSNVQEELKISPSEPSKIRSINQSSKINHKK